MEAVVGGRKEGERNELVPHNEDGIVKYLRPFLGLLLPVHNMVSYTSAQKERGHQVYKFYQNSLLYHSLCQGILVVWCRSIVTQCGCGGRRGT